MLVHCVFSTKKRVDIIRDPQRLCRYLSGIARAKEIPLVAAGGTSNHLHLLLDLPPTLPLAQAMQVLKGNSSHWLNEEQPPFAWQQGYGAFGVCESQRQHIIAYIAGQAEHHKKWSFENEFLAHYCANTGFNTMIALCSVRSSVVPTALESSRLLLPSCKRLG